MQVTGQAGQVVFKPGFSPREVPGSAAQGQAPADLVCTGASNTSRLSESHCPSIGKGQTLASVAFGHFSHRTGQDS